MSIDVVGVSPKFRAVLDAIPMMAPMDSRVSANPAGEMRPRPAALSEDRFLIDAIPAHVWRSAPDGAIQFANQQWFDYTGLSLEQTRDWVSISAEVVHSGDRCRHA